MTQRGIDRPYPRRCGGSPLDVGLGHPEDADTHEERTDEYGENGDSGQGTGHDRSETAGR